MRSFRALVLPLGRPHVVMAVAALTTCAIWFAWPIGVTPGELKNPRAADRQVTAAVVQRLAQDHLSRHAMDDEISSRALDLFIKMIDPQKRYFLQSDIDEFNQYRTQLDDMIKRRDVSVAYRIYDRYLDRVDQRLKDVEELLKATHDFTVDEEIERDPDDMKYATTEQELRDRWRKLIKFEILVLRANDETDQSARERLTRRYSQRSKLRHQTDADELLEMFLTSVTTSFDPHTSYMSPTTLDDFNINMRLNLEGIGAALQMTDGYTVVSKVIPGGAADKAGELKAEDRIVSVGDGVNGELVDVVDMKLRDVVDRIRGKAGTVVRLGVIPHGSTEVKVYSITRAKVELKDSEARGEVIEQGVRTDGKPFRIGVIDLPSFYMDMEAARRNGSDDYKSTTRDVRKILEGFQQQHVDGVVLDLRRNGGGSLTEAIQLTGLFIKDGPVVQVKDAEGRIQQYDDSDPGITWSGPLVVLVSRFSASASEILAGAIQDYGRGLIIGDKSTHGKGTVQSLLDLGNQLFRVPNAPSMGALKITMQQFYRPKGDSTQRRGVVSDVPLPGITNEMKNIGESDLPYAVEFDHVDPAQFAGFKGMVDGDMVQKLGQQSLVRQEKSADFQKLEKNLQRYRDQVNKKAVTLNEAKFMAERAELDADREEEKKLREQQENSDAVVKRDYYFNEVLDVTVDYLQVLAQRDPSLVAGRDIEAPAAQSP